MQWKQNLVFHQVDLVARCLWAKYPCLPLDLVKWVGDTMLSAPEFTLSFLSLSFRVIISLSERDVSSLEVN